MLIKICLVCGKEFIKNKNVSLADWLGSKRRPLGVRFCSQICNGKFNQNGKKTRFKKGQLAINPIKKGFHLSPDTQFKKGNKLSELTKSKMKGRLPWNKGKKFIQVRGCKHHNWKGGSTKLSAAIRMLMEYKLWRKSVFERDGYKCTNCKGCHIKGDRRQLHCHHIIPFYKLLSDNNIATLDDARSCKELWDISNGQTLCIPCHKQTDSYLINQHNKTEGAIP